MRPIKKDSYFRSRGSICATWRIMCARCGAEAFVYQKDGRGILKRAYLNRIRAPEQLAQLQDHSLAVRNLQALKCFACGMLIGAPMRHREGRLAFKLLPGNWKKQILRS